LRRIFLARTLIVRTPTQKRGKIIVEAGITGLRRRLADVGIVILIRLAGKDDDSRPQQEHKFQIIRSRRPAGRQERFHKADA
jgi:hypothetical protein